MPDLIPFAFYPEDLIRPEWLTWWMHNLPPFLRSLEQLQNDKSYRRKYADKNVMIQPSEEQIMKRKPNDTTAKGLGAGTRGKSNKSFPVEWINIKLTDADNALLGGDPSDLPFLTSALVSMVCDGIFVSIKFLSERNQYCVSIIRSDSQGVHQSVGLSGFAPELRDACLVALYKFHHCLRGEWPEGLSSDADNEPKRFG